MFAFFVFVGVCSFIGGLLGYWFTKKLFGKDA